MRTLSKTVKCPVCAQPASLVLFDDGGFAVDGGTAHDSNVAHDSNGQAPAGHRFEFRCSNRRHRLDDMARSQLWAA